MCRVELWELATLIPGLTWELFDLLCTKPAWHSICSFLFVQSNASIELSHLIPVCMYVVSSEFLHLPVSLRPAETAGLVLRRLLGDLLPKSTRLRAEREAGLAQMLSDLANDVTATSPLLMSVGELVRCSFVIFNWVTSACFVLLRLLNPIWVWACVVFLISPSV